CDPGTTTTCTPMYGRGDGSFGATPPVVGDYVGRQLRAVAVAALEGHNVPDFIGGSPGAAPRPIFFRAWPGAVTAHITLATAVHPRSLAAGDLNGDNRPDLVVVNEGSNDLSIFINQGNRTFQTIDRRPFKADGNTPSAVALGDMDGDKRLDIVVTFQ